MTNNIPFIIALRYLFAKKSHSAVNAIALVSVAGVAVATAAVVCVLSVFNGFQAVLTERMDTLSPDFMVTPREGKTIANGDSLAAEIGRIKGVETATPTLTDNALGFFGGRETPITLKGVVPEQYSKVTAIDSLLIGGGTTLRDATSANPALLSIGLAYKLSMFDYTQPLMVFAPKRTGRFNPANPAAAFVMDSVYVADVFQSLQDTYDENCLFTDISLVRDLLLYDREATAIEIKAAAGADTGALLDRISRQVGDRYEVKDRLMQQQLNFRMVQIEKWMTFLLLFFILVIASFNIVSTLSMLVLEKQDSMRTLSAMGMSRRQIASVFRWESVLVSLFGAIAGLALGAALCLLQEKFGFITIANGGVDEAAMAYPVRLEGMDLLITLAPIAAITAICAWVAGSFANSRLKTEG
ncbi:MAG: ABC transporter permease [Muribaculaceae bacterium]|nr:ABC transporter permease [Muribaculaceae bacterium]